MEEKKHIKLSKTILDMKFMKKTKERVQKEEEDEESKAMYSNEITDEMRKGENIVFIETSIVNCKDLIDGRLSFGGMNRDVEKLMSNNYIKKLEKAEQRKEKDVTDVEMAKGYSTLVDTMGKKLQNKRSRKFYNKNFLKPSEDL